MFIEFSKKVECNFKWYYIDVKKSNRGDIYIKLTLDEAKYGEEKRSIDIIFEDHFDKVFPVLEEAMKYAQQNKKTVKK
jgi:hypothetical protein